MNDDAHWWLSLPACPACGKPHVLTDCTQRLPWEATVRKPAA